MKLRRVAAVLWFAWGCDALAAAVLAGKASTRADGLEASRRVSPASHETRPTLHGAVVEEPLLDPYRPFEALRGETLSREPLQKFFSRRPHLIVNRLAEVGWSLKLSLIHISEPTRPY